MFLPAPDPAGAGQPLFGLNGPCWSLFFELIANALFALSHRLLRGPTLCGLLAAAAAGVVAAALAWRGLDAGWNWTSLPAGVARVGFGCFLGVALYRHRAMLRPYWRPAPVMLLLILPLVLTAPLPAGGARVAYDLFVEVVGAPGLVLLAAAREPGPALTRLCQALGVMSYGLYALHVPTYELLRRMGLAPSAWQVAATLAALAAAVLWLDRVYDQPIRARLAPLYRASATPRRADAIPVA